MLLIFLFRSYTEFLPAYAFQAIKDLTMININPPEGVAVVNGH